MTTPRDVGEPGYPDPWTTTQPREGLRDTDKAYIVSLSPDVCLTPVGSSVVAIPYPVVDFCGHDENYTPSVRFTGQKAMVMRSCTSHVHGDSPGVRKGVKSGTVEGICEPIGHADQVRAEGSHVIRHLDRFWMNNRNTIGEAVFVRGTQTYDPPVDDDPIRGSLRAIEIADASDSKKTATDAGGSGGAVLGFLAPAAVPAAEALAGGGAATASGAATAGGAATGTAAGLGLGTVLTGIGVFAAGMLFPTNKMNFSDVVPQDDYELGLLRDAQQRIGALPFWDSDSDIRSQTMAKVYQYRETKKARDPDPDPKPVPVPLPTGSNVRIDEDYDRRCPVKTIPFESHGKRQEFERQIEEQEDRLNRMTVGEYMQRRTPIRPGIPGREQTLASRRAASLPHQEQARRDYIRDNQGTYIAQHGRPAWQSHLSSLAATHELDLIAGGYENEISGMGGAAENSSIGPQWRADSRSGVLDRHAEELARNGCPMMRVNLVVN